MCGFKIWEKFAIVDPDSGKWEAFVVGNPESKALTQSGPPSGFAGTQDGPHYTWPACVIGKDDLNRLKSFLNEEKTVKVCYKAITKYKPGLSSFIVEGKLVGDTRPDDIIVIGGHHALPKGGLILLKACRTCCLLIVGLNSLLQRR